jgi:2-beta-glucuronyltransferase
MNGCDPSSPASRFVVVSGYHDYRSSRKANLHFIADDLAKRGSVFFLSLRYSALTRFKDDPRRDLRARANRTETVNGVDCYLWYTPLHPFGLPQRLAWLEAGLFAAAAQVLPRVARNALARATTIFIESGIGLIYLPLIRRLNPGAEVVYMASDSLDAINQARAIKAAFHRHAALIDRARLPSPLLRSDVPASVPCHVIPHGIEKARFADIGPSPYRPGTRNAVSVGSMLFDSSFFALAGPLFPDVTFHVIGSGHAGPDTENVRYLPEMPFADTLPYLRHADLAIAPYGAGVEPYLTHTSMKLTQYSFLGVPAVCPAMLVAEPFLRFGYRPGDAESIAQAITAALANTRAPRADHLDWAEVTARLLDPNGFGCPLIAPATGDAVSSNRSVRSAPFAHGPYSDRVERPVG